MSDDDEIEFIEMSASPNKRQRTEQIIEQLPYIDNQMQRSISILVNNIEIRITVNQQFNCREVKSNKC